MMRGHDNLSVNDQMEDLRERMRLLQGDRKVRQRRHPPVFWRNVLHATREKISRICLSQSSV